MSDGDADAKAWLAGVFDRAASTYDTVAGAYHEHFGERLVSVAGVSAGDAVLDVGCGRGAALVPAARAVGPDGRVVGVDLSHEMVRLASAALASAGLRGEVVVGDAERLDVEPASFSVVLCAFGLFFLADPEAAAAGFRAALAPGGVVGVSTWGDEDERWAWEDELLADVSVERRAVVRPLATTDEVAALLAGAGFSSVDVRVEDHEVRLADADEWWAWKWSYSLRGVLEQLPPERIERLRQEASAHLEPPLDRRLQAILATGRAA